MFQSGKRGLNGLPRWDLGGLTARKNRRVGQKDGVRRGELRGGGDRGRGCVLSQSEPGGLLREFGLIAIFAQVQLHEMKQTVGSTGTGNLLSEFRRLVVGEVAVISEYPVH